MTPHFTHLSFLPRYFIYFSLHFPLVKTDENPLKYLMVTKDLERELGTFTNEC